MEDLIRREDAIKALYKYNFVTKEVIEREIMSISSADRPQGEVDAIDRDALIDYCLKLIDVERKQGSDVMNYGQERVNQTEAIIDYIEYMPHVNADRPRGEWIINADRSIYKYHCTNCEINSKVDYDYCPWCGARMKGADDECGF